MTQENEPSKVAAEMPQELSWHKKIRNSLRSALSSITLTEEKKVALNPKMGESEQEDSRIMLREPSWETKPIPFRNDSNQAQVYPYKTSNHSRERGIILYQCLTENMSPSQKNGFKKTALLIKLLRQDIRTFSEEESLLSLLGTSREEIEKKLQYCLDTGDKGNYFRHVLESDTSTTQVIAENCLKLNANEQMQKGSISEEGLSYFDFLSEKVYDTMPFLEDLLALMDVTEDEDWLLQERLPSIKEKLQTNAQHTLTEIKEKYETLLNELEKEKNTLDSMRESLKNLHTKLVELRKAGDLDEYQVTLSLYTTMQIHYRMGTDGLIKMQAEVENQSKKIKAYDAFERLVNHSPRPIFFLESFNIDEAISTRKEEREARGNEPDFDLDELKHDFEMEFYIPYLDEFRRLIQYPKYQEITDQAQAYLYDLSKDLHMELRHGKEPTELLIWRHVNTLSKDDPDETRAKITEIARGVAKYYHGFSNKLNRTVQLAVQNNVDISDLKDAQGGETMNIFNELCEEIYTQAEQREVERYPWEALEAELGDALDYIENLREAGFGEVQLCVIQNEDKNETGILNDLLNKKSDSALRIVVKHLKNLKTGIDMTDTSKEGLKIVKNLILSFYKKLKTSSAVEVLQNSEVAHALRRFLDWEEESMNELLEFAELENALKKAGFGENFLLILKNSNQNILRNIQRVKKIKDQDLTGLEEAAEELYLILAHC